MTELATNQASPQAFLITCKERCAGINGIARLKPLTLSYCDMFINRLSYHTGLYLRLIYLGDWAGAILTNAFQ